LYFDEKSNESYEYLFEKYEVSYVLLALDNNSKLNLDKQLFNRIIFNNSTYIILQ
jgi:hypothetical protein